MLRRTRRFSVLLLALALIGVGAASVARAAEIVPMQPLREIPGIEVYAEIPEVVFQSEFSARFEMVNAGSVPYTDVVLAPQDSCHPSFLNGTVEFSEISGNGDDVFDPDETWSYAAPECVEWAGPWLGVDVSVGGISEVGFYWYDYEPIGVVSVVQELGEVSLAACESSDHVITVQNVSTNDLIIDYGQISPWMSLDNELVGVLIPPGQSQNLVFNWEPNCDNEEPPPLQTELLLDLYGRFTDNEGHDGEWFYGAHPEQFDWNYCDSDQLYAETCGDDWAVGTIVAYEGAAAPALVQPEQPTLEVLPFTGIPLGLLVALATTLLGSGIWVVRSQGRRGENQAEEHLPPG